MSELDWLTKCQYVWHFWLRGDVFTHVIGQCDHASVYASSAVCQTNRVFSQNMSFLKLSVSEGNHRLGSCGFRGRPGIITRVSPYGFSCRNTNALIHSHMYSQSNPASRNKKAELRFAEVHAFFKYWLQEGEASDESLAEVHSVTSPWVVNLPSSHHSHSRLINRIKCSA